MKSVARIGAVVALLTSLMAQAVAQTPGRCGVPQPNAERPGSTPGTIVVQLPAVTLASAPSCGSPNLDRPRPTPPGTIIVA